MTGVCKASFNGIIVFILLSISNKTQVNFQSEVVFYQVQIGNALAMKFGFDKSTM